VSIIDSLSAGYRFLTKRPDLLLIPLFLDILLWVSPRLSIVSLFEQVSQLYLETAQTATLSEEIVALVEQAAQGISAVGQSSNLLNLLVNSTLLHVPSLLIVLEPLAGSQLRDITDPYAVTGLALLFSLSGLLLGVIYMELMARYLPIGALPKAVEWPEFISRSFRHWGLLIVWVVAMILIMLALSIPVALAIMVVSLISPSVASLLTVFLGSLIMILFFYLYFVAAGLILDNLPLYNAVIQSFVLVRNRFWKTLGFIILTNFISLGCGLLLDQLASYQPVGTLAAILLNAYIGSGLVMALLIFYRTQLITPDEQELKLVNSE